MFFDNYSFFSLKNFVVYVFLYFCTVPMLEVFHRQKQKAPSQVMFCRDAIFGKGVYHTLVL